MKSKENNREKKVTIRLTPSEFGMWKQASEMAGTTMSELIRATLEKRNIIVINGSEELKKAVRDQARIGNLLVQIDRIFVDGWIEKMKVGEIQIEELKQIGQKLRTSRDQLHDDLIAIRREVIKLRAEVGKAQSPGGNVK